MTQVFRLLYAPTYDVLCREKDYAGEIGRRMIEETNNCHTMRYFSSEEMELLISDSGFRLLRLGAFPDFDCEPDIATWNVMTVAVAV